MKIDGGLSWSWEYVSWSTGVQLLLLWDTRSHGINWAPAHPVGHSLPILGLWPWNPEGGLDWEDSRMQGMQSPEPAIGEPALRGAAWRPKQPLCPLNKRQWLVWLDPYSRHWPHTSWPLVWEKEAGDGPHLTVKFLTFCLGKPFIGDLKSIRYWSLESADEWTSIFIFMISIWNKSARISQTIRFHTFDDKGRREGNILSFLAD